MPKYFDIHSHLYFPDYGSDREEVISRMKENGIWTTTIGTDLESSKQAIALAEKHQNLFASVGVHPEHINASEPNMYDMSYILGKEFEELVTHPKVVAIGECGFDYFRTSPLDKEKVKANQKKIFEQQVELAIKNNKHLMLHCRPTKGSEDAYIDTLEILEHYISQPNISLSGNAHFFVGSADTLHRFLNLGFTVSFTGVITFTKDYDELVRYTPLDMIHAETDAPFVAPIPYRGKRNSPEYISEVAIAIARIKEENIDTVKTTLISNALRLFKIHLSGF